MSAAIAATVGEALASAADALRAAGVESPRLDAELLLAEAADVDRASIVATPGRGVDAIAARRFGELVRRRVRREPVAYLLGRKGFHRIELEVDGRVLIPRPETELLVEVAVELEPRRVLDVGTGSGAVALAVAAELDGVEVVASDTSLEALAVARRNAVRLGLADRVRFVTADRQVGGRFDMVVANLPYVGEAEWGGLAPEIVRYEPREALVAGPSGLEAIEGLLGELASGAIEAAVVAVEVGAGQASTVAELVRRAGFERVDSRRDLAGIERVVIGR